ncbi:MAG: low molecular weight protein-tyrosine-phosphatase [Flavobacteriales bacterium]|jgi:protein-tyrosine phosphatase
MRILMVCLGNICRSPLADGILRYRVSQKNLNWVVDSAGTAGYHVGSPPDDRMIKTAYKNGIALSSLRARQFTCDDFEAFDRIYVMDRSNYKNIITLAKSPTEKAKVHFLLDHLFPNQEEEVPDPYYGSQKDFDHVFHLTDRAINQLLKDLSHG